MTVTCAHMHRFLHCFSFVLGEPLPQQFEGERTVVFVGQAVFLLWGLFSYPKVFPLFKIQHCTNILLQSQILVESRGKNNEVNYVFLVFFSQDIKLILYEVQKIVYLDASKHSLID